MIQIPCRVDKRENGTFTNCQSVGLKDLGCEISSCVTALYPNHADASDNSNLVIVVEEVGRRI